MRCTVNYNVKGGSMLIKKLVIFPRTARNNNFCLQSVVMSQVFIVVLMSQVSLGANVAVSCSALGVVVNKKTLFFSFFY